MEKIKAAIFDMDGTLLDSMNFWTFCPEIYIKSLGMKPEEGLGKKLFSMSMKEGANFLKNEYKLSFSTTEICRGINNVLKNAYANTIQFKEGAEVFLKSLKNSGVKTALCTNTDRELFEPALLRLNANKYFDRIFTATEMGMTKEHPEIFNAVSDFLKSAPNETWVFEDALYAIRTASNAGFKTCGIYDKSYENHTEEIKKYSTIYCKNYEEAKNFFLI